VAGLWNGIPRFQEGCVLRMHTRLLSVGMLAMASICLLGCPQRTTIEKINRDPGRYAGKEVTIAGRVTSSFGALGTGVFELEDGTGRMWVYSERYGVPGRDAKIAVTGRIQQGFTFGGRSFATILRETERRR
jgi:hypothetical protein